MKLSNNLKTTLVSLSQVGTVRGVCLCSDGQILENLFPFSLQRMQSLCDEAIDIFSDFSGRGRDVERLVIGYDGGQLVILADGGLLLLLMHMIPDEADFVAKAGRAFLNDYRLENGVAKKVMPFPEKLPKDGQQAEVEKSMDPVEPVVARSGPMTFRELLADAENAPERYSAEHSLVADDVAESSGRAKEASKDMDVTKSPPRPVAFAARAQRKAPVKKRIVGEVVVQPARLAAQQPQSTLPPQKKPRLRSRRQSS